MTVIGGELGERGERPAPVLVIGEMSAARIAQLTMKLAEYAERDRTSGVDEHDHPEWIFARRGEHMLKAPVLDYVLSVARDSRRVLAEAPITVAEVATAMEGLLGFDLTVSKTNNFMWSDLHEGSILPDFEMLARKGANIYDAAFTSAYGLVYSYSIGDTREIVGGTGLPEVPTDTASEASSED